MTDPKNPKKPQDRSLQGALSSVLGAVVKPSTPAAATPKSRTQSPRISVLVEDPRRAGVAPYNFVPLPDEARYLTENEVPPFHSAYHEGLLTGEIVLNFEALTGFYVRGMSSLDEYSARRSEDKPLNTKPFLSDGKLCLPGPSLRGMTRQLIEILGSAPLEFVNNSLLPFRAVGASANPRDVSSFFEPQAVAYKNRMVPALTEATASSAVVKAGYLYGGRDDWFIHPAEWKAGRQWYQVRLAFAPNDLQRSQYQWSRPRQPVFFRPTEGVLAEISQTAKSGFESGRLVCSGVIPKKKRQWILRPEEAKPIPVSIPQVDVQAYLETGITKDIKDHEFAYHAKSSGDTVFYVEWKDSNGDPHVSFGHTHFFRLPYAHSIHDAIPRECLRTADNASWDLAQAMFGRLETNSSGFRGRLAFEDAMLQSGPEVPYESQVKTLILGNPKPTTYQHYIVQTGTRVEDSLHWDGDYNGKGTAVIRGYKQYWHRPGASPRYLDKPEPGKPNKVATQIQPARKGCIFQSRLRFENLRDWELGALLTALDLPTGCAHKIGLAKAHGLGSFKISIGQLMLSDRKLRYSTFLNVSAQMETGEAPVENKRIDEWKDVFARWAMRDPSANAGKLWQEARMRELRALLTMEGLPPDWSNRTRYLEFGSVPESRVPYNEYQNIGYPKADQRGRWETQKRRPLPPASQVISDRRLPASPRPPIMLKNG